MAIQRLHEYGFVFKRGCDKPEDAKKSDPKMPYLLISQLNQTVRPK